MVSNPSASLTEPGETGVCTVKKVIVFPVPSRDVKTKLSLARNYKIIPGQGSLVSDIPAGDGKNDNLFYSVGSLILTIFLDKIYRRKVPPPPLPTPNTLFSCGKKLPSQLLLFMNIL
jgi:hypothetical protein